MVVAVGLWVVEEDVDGVEEVLVVVDVVMVFSVVDGLAWVVVEVVELLTEDEEVDGLTGMGSWTVNGRETVVLVVVADGVAALVVVVVV